MAFSTCLYIFIEFSTIHISIEHDFCNWQELSLFTVSRLICLSIYKLQKPVSIHEDLTCTCIYMLFICYREIYLFIHLVIDRLEWTRIHVNKPNPPSTVLFLYTTRSQMAPTYFWIHHRRDAHPWSTYFWIHHKRDAQPWFNTVPFKTWIHLRRDDRPWFSCTNCSWVQQLWNVCGLTVDPSNMTLILWHSLNISFVFSCDYWHSWNWYIYAVLDTVRCNRDTLCC